MKNPPVLNDVLLICKLLDFQVKDLGLMPKYRQDEGFKLRVKKLADLAFIPVSDLVATFESLLTSFLYDELRLLAYFENTWIGQPDGRRRLPPLFPTTVDPHELRMPLKLFTTPSSFNSLLTCQHPTIWKLLESLESQKNLSDEYVKIV